MGDVEMNTIDPSELRIVAGRLTELGARTARGFFGNVTASRKADDSPVTEADHAAQATILDVIADDYPEHAVLTEEPVPEPDRHAPVAACEYCWIVDPIDGTRNFARGVGVWSTSVGVLREGRPVAGAIYDATTGRVYSASVGGGVWCGDQRITTVGRDIDGDTTIAIASLHRRRMPLALQTWLERYQLRNLGSLCLHLVWVAADMVDAVYASECKLWDIAAGSLLIEEAGGVVTDHKGRAIWPVDPAKYDDESLPILAGFPQTHSHLLASLLNEDLPS